MKKFLTISCIFMLVSISACSNRTADLPDKQPAVSAVESASPSLSTEDVQKTSTPILQIDESIELDKIEIAMPIEESISNNGGTVIQYGDRVYFYGSSEDTESYLGYPIFVMREDGTDKHHLIDTRFRKKLYVVDNYLITSGFHDENYTIARVSLETENSEYLDQGQLEYVDTEKKEIYFSVNNYDLPDEEKGIYKMNIDGSCKIKLCPYGYSFLEKIDDIVYLDAPHTENSNDAVLASMNSDGSDLKTIATIPAMEVEFNITENEYIVDFGLCDDWIILSVGSYQGSGHFFYGGLVRMRKDGSELEHFYPSDIDSFEIIDDWIYFNDWNTHINPEGAGGCYRMRPDLSEKEYFGEEVQCMYAYSKDGYLYYTYDPVRKPSYNIINDLRQCTPDSKNVVTLFHGSNAPQFEDSSYTSYSNIEKSGEYVYFGVDVHGDAKGDSWRGHTCYYGYYRVRKDGNGLELLYEDKIFECPAPAVD